MKPRRLTAALLAVAIAALPVASPADPMAGSDDCRPFASGSAIDHPLQRLCARLVEAQRRGHMTKDETEAARRLADYVAVLARLELRLVPEADGYRLRVARRTSETARYLIASHLGLIELANRLAPAV